MLQWEERKFKGSPAITHLLALPRERIISSYLKKYESQKFRCIDSFGSGKYSTLQKEVKLLMLLTLIELHLICCWRKKICFVKRYVSDFQSVKVSIRIQVPNLQTVLGHNRFCSLYFNRLGEFYHSTMLSQQSYLR